MNEAVKSERKWVKIHRRRTKTMSNLGYMRRRRRKDIAAVEGVLLPA